MTATQKTIVKNNSGLTVRMAEYIIEHSSGVGKTLSADAFWNAAFGSTTLPAGVNGCSKAVFLAAVKAGVDALQ